MDEKSERCLLRHFNCWSFFSGTNPDGAAWCQQPKAVARDMQLRILMRPPATARNTYLIPCYQITSNKNQISKLQALYGSPKFPIMFTKKYVTLPFLSLHLPYLLRKKPLLHSPAVQRVFAAPVWTYFVARPKHSQLQGLRAGRRRSVEKPENGRWENPMGFMGFIFPLPPPQFLVRGFDIVFWGGKFFRKIWKPPRLSQTQQKYTFVGY